MKSQIPNRSLHELMDYGQCKAHMSGSY